MAGRCSHVIARAARDCGASGRIGSAEVYCDRGVHRSAVGLKARHTLPLQFPQHLLVLLAFEAGAPDFLRLKRRTLWRRICPPFDRCERIGGAFLWDFRRGLENDGCGLADDPVRDAPLKLVSII